MVTVPTGLATTSSWQLVDQKSLVLTTQAAASGVATATFPQLDTGYQWLIDRAVVSCTSQAATQLRLYDTNVGPGQLLSGSNSGNYDEADYPAGLLLPAGGQLVAQWTGADNGSIGTVRLQVRVLLRSGS